MLQPLRILHLEDDPVSAELVKEALAKDGLAPEMQVAASREAYFACLDRDGFDVVLSDTGLPGFDSLSALDAVRERYPGTPFIVVSGGPPDRVLPGLEARGAGPFVPKAHLDLLAPAIRRILHARAGAGDAAAADRLISVVQELSLARDLPTVMDIVRHAARNLTGADGATFVLRDGELCHYADEDAIAPLWKGLRFPMSACISGWAMLNKQAVAIEDIYADPRIPADAYRPTFVKSLAMVPIRSAAPIGAIGNYWASPHRTTPEELRLLQALADSTSIAMENIALYEGLERRVAERTAQLEAANAELTAFSYSVSHDLQAPLRAIDGFSALLLERLGEGIDAKSRVYLHHIVNSTKRMGQLIEDLLKLSRIIRTPMLMEEVDLSAIAGEIAAAMQAAEPQRQVELHITPGVKAWGDARLLRAALENLLSNAWKYSSKKPWASIAFGARPEGDGALRYFVQDDGAGFDMAYSKNLFGAFQRLHSEAEFPGTGIGLATVQRIVHRHGGRIWAEAEPDKGATFSFTLPLGEP